MESLKAKLKALLQSTLRDEELKSDLKEGLDEILKDKKLHDTLEETIITLCKNLSTRVAKNNKVIVGASSLAALVLGNKIYEHLNTRRTMRKKAEELETLKSEISAKELKISELEIKYSELAASMKRLENDCESQRREKLSLLGILSSKNEFFLRHKPKKSNAKKRSESVNEIEEKLVETQEFEAID